MSLKIPPERGGGGAVLDAGACATTIPLLSPTIAVPWVVSSFTGATALRTGRTSTADKGVRSTLLLAEKLYPAIPQMVAILVEAPDGGAVPLSVSDESSTS